VLSLPPDIGELKLRIAASDETIDGDMLETVWDALDCRLDIVESPVELILSKSAMLNFQSLSFK
jgi:hypothetical protein